MIGGIAPHNASNERPCAEQPAGQGRQLVRRLGVCMRGDKLASRVFGVERGGRSRQLWVSDESAVVDTPGEVEGCVCLQAVADGDDG